MFLSPKTRSEGPFHPGFMSGCFRNQCSNSPVYAILSNKQQWMNILVRVYKASK